MFDTGEIEETSSNTEVAWLLQTAGQIAKIRRDLTDTTRADVITALEVVKSASAATQAVATADLHTSRRAERAAKGLPKRQWDIGVASEIGLARRDSANKGGRHLGFARVLVDEMPNTLARLACGDLSEWRATVIVRDTFGLSREDRALVDRELCSDPATLRGKSDSQVSATARAAVVRIDAEALVRRASKAVGDRRVTSRPAPDTMAYLSALLPVKQAVCVHATLMRDSAAILGAGDERTKSQIMADLLVERVTGLSTATAVPVTVNVVLSDEALLGTGSEPAEVEGYGPVPTDLVIRWLHDDDAKNELRRLYANPETGALTAMESKSRGFPTGILRMTKFRDKICRTPWCGAPIRHGDHVRSVANGGDTTFDNSAGLCEACNYAKEADGWTTTPDKNQSGELHSYRITTPTGHHFRSTAPALPKPLPHHNIDIVDSWSVEDKLVQIIWAA
ncbi:HNH endonuclease [Antrihabitans spumae]|jgi:hypothetical protein|uniref:HNH endonuclease n=1 Tax=Antrihabitans spumae TaxID=3373370 RepID=A0ABW7KN66_9NOCA